MRLDARSEFEPLAVLATGGVEAGCIASGVPPVCARYIPNFTTPAAKLVCRAGRKGRSTWPGLEL
jgi:hypothetical protein